MGDGSDPGLGACGASDATVGETSFAGGTGAADTAVAAGGSGAATGAGIALAGLEFSTS